MGNTEILSVSFLLELLKLCFFKKDVIEIVREHLKYEYIPGDRLKGKMGAYKQIFKNIITYYTNNNRLPTIGVISQLNSTNNDIQEILKEINDIKLPDKEVVFVQFEAFLKRVKFQELYEKTADLYNTDKQEEAILLLAKESEKIANFSILSTLKGYNNVFEGYRHRRKEREINSLYSDTKIIKIPTGIDVIDSTIDGGIEKGETDLFMARSGGGKTKFLRWRGVSSARRGFKVLHFQAEGSEKECLDGYDATWTAQLKRDIRYCHLSPEIEERLERITQDILNKSGEISVIAFEQFNTANMADIRNKIYEYKKINGVFPDHVILDYLEKVDPGDGRRYATSTEGEKMRREAVADKIKNIAVECELAFSAANQANDISPNEWNRAEWYMTRHNVSGAKGLVNPFSYFWTWNVTNDERKNNTGRIYMDKLREFRPPDGPVHIATNFARDRFYDRKRSLELFYEK